MEVNLQRSRELRRQRVLSMRELEEASGVSYNTICYLETVQDWGAAAADFQDRRRAQSIAGGTT